MIVRGLITFFFIYLGLTTIRSQENPFPPLKIMINDTSAMQGDVACFDFRVENFINIELLTFTIHFDPTVLTPQFPVNQTYLPSLETNGFGDLQIEEGNIRFLWLDPNVGQTCGVNFPDNNAIFTICFDVIGEPGTTSPIYLSGEEINIEYNQVIECMDTTISVDGNYEFLTKEETEATFITTCGFLSIFTDQCASTPSANTGLFSFYGCGGSIPYTYAISGGTTLNGNIDNEREEIIIDNLAPGTYDIVITDATGASTNTTVSISTGDALDVSVDITPPSCWDRGPGRGNGVIEILDISGGVPPYMVVWDNFNFKEWPNNEIVDYRRLHNGSYGLTVTDANGCNLESTFNVMIDTIKVEATLLGNTTCEGSQDGRVRLTATGGRPYNGNEYSFNGRPPSPTFTDMQAVNGWYLYSASDNSSPTCKSAIDSIFIPADDVVDVDITVDSISCFGLNDGFFEAIVQGGSNLGFRWSLVDENGNPPPQQGTQQNRVEYRNPNLYPSNWFFTAEDRQLGCLFEYNFEIIDPPLVEIEIDSLNPSCLGNDGYISINVTGGTISDGYTFIWADGSTDSVRTDLTGGNYMVTVEDDNGCGDTYSINLLADGQIIVDTQINQEISCHGGSDGEVSAMALSQGDFSYRWYQDSDTIGTTRAIGNLSAGIYQILTKDTLLGCFTIDTVELQDPAPLAINVNYSMPSCPFPDFTNGNIGIATTNVLDTFSFLWDDGSTGSVRGAIAAGQYAVTITNNFGCQLDTFLTLENPEKIQVNVSQILGVECYGSASGSAVAVASGGTVNDGRYNFLWSNGGIDNDMDVALSMASNLEAGMQYVIVTDVQCPSDTIFFEVPDIAPIQLDMDQSIINNPNCYDRCDGSVTVVAMGGNPNSYSYQWTYDNSTTPTLSGLCDGIYFVEITDDNNCTTLDSVIMTQPDSLSVVIDPNLTIDPNCFNTGQAQIGVRASGGTPDYDFAWSDDVSNDQIAEELVDGTYVITVTDANGCRDVASYIIISPEPIEADIPQPEQPQCFGDQTCIAIDNISGGSEEGYTFTVNRGVRFPIDSCLNVFAGPYTVTVFDSEGCSEEYQIIIEQPEPITVDLGEDIEISLGEDTPPINADISAAYNIADIQWEAVDTINCLTTDCQIISIAPIESSSVTVYVIDENGCIGSDELNILVNKKRNVYTANVFSPNQDGNNDYFQLVTGPGVKLVEEFYIFDRWGNGVWQQVNYMPDPSGTDGWDGNINGQAAQPGVYGYFARVKFIDDEFRVFKGDITLIR